MITLKILHTTTYRFNESVRLLPHRLMLRPRESRELRLISSHVRVMPHAVLTWAHDVFCNAIATATFQTTASNLVIASVAELQLLGVSQAVRYQSRQDEGTQTPVETLNRGWGSCRDFAVLFTEAARMLGFGARIVSGYLYNPNQQSVGSSDAGSTHAWAEVFIQAPVGSLSTRQIAAWAASI